MSFRIGRFTGGGDALPAPFYYKVSDDGETLELWQLDKKIAEQDQFGSWFAREVTTGVGSFHLSDSHSISSSGQNVGFLNTYSNVNPDDSIFFFPPWQGITVDGDVVIDPSILRFGQKQSTFPNGGTASSVVVDYNFNTSISSNIVVMKVTFYPMEGYTGKLRNIIISNTTNKIIFDTLVDYVSVPQGTPYTITYRYPFFARAGDNLKLQLLKEDGSFLKVKAGSTTTIPYRELVVRSFSDVNLHGANESHTYLGQGSFIPCNGSYTFNNNSNGGTPITCHKDVTWLMISPWDSAMSSSSSQKINLPVGSSGSTSIQLDYASNDPVILHRSSPTSSTWNWKNVRTGKFGNGEDSGFTITDQSTAAITSYSIKMSLESSPYPEYVIVDDDRVKITVRANWNEGSNWVFITNKSGDGSAFIWSAMEGQFSWCGAEESMADGAGIWLDSPDYGKSSHWSVSILGRDSVSQGPTGVFVDVYMYRLLQGTDYGFVSVKISGSF